MGRRDKKETCNLRKMFKLSCINCKYVEKCVDEKCTVKDKSKLVKMRRHDNEDPGIFI